MGIIRYTASIIDWKIQDIKKIYTRTGKVKIMNGAVHARLDVGKFTETKVDKKL